MATNKSKAFTYRFVNEGPNLLLELTNATGQTLKCVEILTVFLKNDDSVGDGPSQIHIRFDGIERMLASEKSIMHHSIWINGKPADGSSHLQRLEAVEGQLNPYVLDISWQNPEGKTRFQRIPVGH